MLRAVAVKAELSDTEGLHCKVDEKNHDIVELKKTVKIKVCINLPSNYINVVYIPSGARIK